MSVPSKIHNIPLVKIQPEERLAATSELNLAPSMVTGCCEANGIEKGVMQGMKCNRKYLAELEREEVRTE